MAEMYLKKVHMTPEMAAIYLNTNDRNRTLKSSKVKVLENAIINGSFQLTHQAIAIDENGKLIDGHHRLTAIVNTGIAIDILAIFNAKESAYIDSGTSRSAKDALFMSGLADKGSIETRNVTQALISFMVEKSLGNSRLSVLTTPERHNLYVKYSKIIDTIVKIASKYSTVGKARDKYTLYAMLCALNSGVPEETIAEWHKIVLTGDFLVEGDEEKSKCGRSILHYKFFIESNSYSGQRRTSNAEERIKKAESSIRHYANGQIISKLYGEQVYPDIKVTEEDLTAKEVIKND